MLTRVRSRLNLAQRPALRVAELVLAGTSLDAIPGEYGLRRCRIIATAAGRKRSRYVVRNAGTEIIKCRGREPPTTGR